MLHSFRHALVSLFLWRKSQLNCVVCSTPVPLKDFRGDIHLRCAACGTNLVLRLGHNWLYTTICLAGGFIAAYLQGLQNPLLPLYALMYSGALVIIAAPILAPFFPVKFKRAPDDYVQTLRLSAK